MQGHARAPLDSQTNNDYEEQCKNLLTRTSQSDSINANLPRNNTSHLYYVCQPQKIWHNNKVGSGGNTE